MSLSPKQVLFEVFGVNAALIWEETAKDRVFVRVESRGGPIVEVANDFVIAQHANSDFLESAPFVDLEELGQLRINFEPHFAVGVDLCG